MAINAAYEDKVLTLVNRRRSAAGCGALRSNEKLRRSARTHSVGMAQYGTMTHFLPGEAGLGQRVTFAGYRDWRRLAENIASGFSSPRAVMRAWMASPEHRANILDCRLRHLGVGVVAQGSRLWWTQDFGRR
ncbi:CAP domain-containing protein [Nocardioides albidus]|uniref:CAP domain-containing protein n=2 Tax=Nocardioides albidus TaxID=1517589 RepID=A0A5C4VS49_9ACTN|nr:CAP domain-containing protein [Nocardioides albidus]